MQQLSPRSQIRDTADLDVKTVIVQAFSQKASFNASKERVAAAFRCTIEKLTIYFTRYRDIVDNHSALSSRLPTLKAAKTQQWEDFWGNYSLNRPSPDDGAKLDQDQARFDTTIAQVSAEIDAWEKKESEFYWEVANGAMEQYGNILTAAHAAEWTSNITNWSYNS